ncbi:Sodium-coupled monocarboxylate transporter 1-like 5 [Homarus americanus]|uniref:Sodium-coupled monocarboxylate transporter 1-like 5 n=1 Tax=Homarus americanus TaxID=6706 RepID=A0A8J5N7P2_HOMAM|nr:Sodium-coupled monocarboxylate transporter 1-like 5 [Homarus americanus]
MSRLCIIFVAGSAVLWSLFFTSGLVAYATYSQCDPLTAGYIEKPDQIIPYLVMDKLNYLPGVAGLFVAAVYGGLLSSLSSCGNAAACIIWEDFLKYLPCFAAITDKKIITILRVLSVACGGVGLGVAIMVRNLGDIFNVTQSILSAVVGPSVGVFLTGMCTPWANTKVLNSPWVNTKVLNSPWGNTKGTTVGFSMATIYSLWLVIGKFIQGGGSPPRLPLSTHGCQGVFLNTSFTDALLSNTTSVDESEDLGIYDVSYCYIGISGIIINMVVASIVSLFTGVLKPGEVASELVSPSCERLHHWLWQNTPKCFNIRKEDQDIQDGSSFRPTHHDTSNCPSISNNELDSHNDYSFNKTLTRHNNVPQDEQERF